MKLFKSGKSSDSVPTYVFLDTWVLSDYTKAAWAPKLADFLAHHQYTVVITSPLLTELYNREWRGGGPSERGARIAAFLAGQHCVIVDPYKVWQTEFSSFPKVLGQMPIELDLDRIPAVPRGQALLMFMRHDDIFLDMGKDIREWADKIAQAKKAWPETVRAIIEHGLRQGVLTRDAKQRLIAPNDEIFLTSLDLRLLESDDFSPYLGRSSLLRSVRLSSRIFWHRYIHPERGHSFQPMPSDLVDIENISLMPYCAVSTVDTKMLPTARLAAQDGNCSCTLLGKHELEDMLRRTGG